MTTLQLTNWRNWPGQSFDFGPGLNVLVGPNAQGKTNVLEAASLLATTRSIRASRESELVLAGAEYAIVDAAIERDRDGAIEIEVTVSASERKSVAVQGNRRPRVVDLLGEFNSVFFGAQNLEIVLGEPSVRRHFLNVEIAQVRPAYVYELAQYKRSLEQRNRLLRDLRDGRRHGASTELEAWTEQLVTHGAPLFNARAEYLARLAPAAAAIHADLAGGELLSLDYRPSVAPGGDSAATVEAFHAALAAVAGEEARRGVTLAGPHRDDFAIAIGGREARTFGSQGQQRTATLAIKLAECDVIRDVAGEDPVLLLDDVMSDLDDARRTRLLERTDGRGQTLLTCTNLRFFTADQLARATIYRIRQGTAEMEPPPPPDTPPSPVKRRRASKAPS